MLYMRSASAGSGSLSITVTFAIGTDPDLATINVDNRVQAALPTLPEEVRRQGVTVPSKRSSTILQIAIIDSPDARHDADLHSNYASLNVIDELRRIPGRRRRAELRREGLLDPRLDASPTGMAQLGLTPADVAAAIREQNAQFAAGRIGAGADPRRRSTSPSPSRRWDASRRRSSSGEIILRTTPDGGVVRLKDVARVELGSRDYDFIGKRNGKPTVPIGIFLQPGANALEVGRGRPGALGELIEVVPRRASISTMPYDTTKFVRVSIMEVLKTLGEAMALVFARRVPVPAELARDADPDAGRAGVADRHVRRRCCCSASRSTR